LIHAAPDVHAALQVPQWSLLLCVSTQLVPQRLSGDGQAFVPPVPPGDLPALAPFPPIPPPEAPLPADPPSPSVAPGRTVPPHPQRTKTPTTAGSHDRKPLTLLESNMRVIDRYPASVSRQSKRGNDVEIIRYSLTSRLAP